jgi:hypothetical protein
VANKFSLDADQRRDIKNSVNGFPLRRVRFDQFIHDIEDSLTHYQRAESEGSFREAHDALRELWNLSHDKVLLKQSPEADAQGEVIRKLIEKLPKKAAQYIDRRVARERRVCFSVTKILPISGIGRVPQSYPT